MRFFYLLLSGLLVCSSTHAQTIKRWSGGRLEMSNKQMPGKLNRHIFKDFGWAKPELKGRKATLENGAFAFDWNNQPFTLTQTSGGLEIKTAEGALITGTKSRSYGDMYFDKSAFVTKSVMKSRWVPHFTMQSQMVMVTRTRPVTRYQYDAYSKSTKPVFTTESYMSSELRMVPKTDWRWENYMVMEYEIPNYDYYSFTMPDSSHLVVYDTRSGFVLQNNSYVSAVDEQGINHVLIDANTNGTFSDEADKIMFNSWNPYSKESKFRPMRVYRENNWYDLVFLKNENFLSVSHKDQLVKLEYENDLYGQSKEKGIVTFTGIPPKTTLLINGQSFKGHTGAKTYKSEYGIFKARISQKGYLDQEVVYTVNKAKNNLTIPYQPTAKAAELEIDNIFMPDYFVTVTTESGYNRTYYNTKELTVPTGTIQLQVYADGFTLPYTFTASADNKTVVDFEAEIKKLKPAEETTEPAESKTKE